VERSRLWSTNIAIYITTWRLSLAILVAKIRVCLVNVHKSVALLLARAGFTTTFILRSYAHKHT
jgi:hypothetical protein